MKGMTWLSKGLLLITLGVLFLLMNFGILSWGFWFNVADLWPVLLILLGISLLLGKRVPFSAILVVFLVILAGYSLTAGRRTLPPAPDFAPFQNMAPSSGSLPINVPWPQGVGKAQVKMNLASAHLDLHPLAPAGKDRVLMQGTYGWQSASPFHGPGLTSRQAGDTLVVSLSAPGLEGLKDDLDLGLASGVKYALTIHSAAMDANMDFGRIPLESFDLSTGACKCRLTFGDTGLTEQGKINSGASDITLVVPENVGLRVHVNGIVGDFMGSGMFLENKDWVSPGYAQAKTKVDLDIATAAGRVHLERPPASSGGAL
ncbi:hypothetical protein CEB3_c23630 [Peptococcaceae bacterium CEB3]|nr:hypothetical protein CEB3_c23630 [Peptococcaceae bacterium CEB3]